MRILATADLHLTKRIVTDVVNILKIRMKTCACDVLVIAGDVCNDSDLTPFSVFKNFGWPVVFCLGNHEFAHNRVQDVLDKYHSLQFENNLCDDIYCLDVMEAIIDDVQFVGNALWYDGSLSETANKNERLKNIPINYKDSTIVDFDPVIEHLKCVDQIKSALEYPLDRIVLVTHTVPYWKLNRFCICEPLSEFNIYSGVRDIFKTHDINVNAAICGHTHRKELIEYREDAKSIFCYNIGNAYFADTHEIETEVITI